MFPLIQLVIAILDLFEVHVHDLNQERQVGLLFIFPDDIGHAYIFDIVEGIGQGKKHPFSGYCRKDLTAKPADFPQDSLECFNIFSIKGRDKFHLKVYNPVPGREQQDSKFFLVVVPIISQPFLLNGMRHG